MSSNILTTLKGGSSAQQPAQVEDCASCRLIGGSAAVGVGSYVSYQSVAQMRAQRAATQAGKGGAGKSGAVAMGALGLGTHALFFSLLILALLLTTSSPFPALLDRRHTTAAIFVGIGRLSGLPVHDRQRAVPEPRTLEKNSV